MTSHASLLSVGYLCWHWSMASKRGTTADRVWKDSHRFGCRCDGTHEVGGDREEAVRYASDACVAPCKPYEPCPTAPLDWNTVRAAFAQAEALKSLRKIALAMEAVASAPVMCMDSDAFASVAAPLRGSSEG